MMVQTRGSSKPVRAQLLPVKREGAETSWCLEVLRWNNTAYSTQTGNATEMTGVAIEQIKRGASGRVRNASESTRNGVGGEDPHRGKWRAKCRRRKGEIWTWRGWNSSDNEGERGPGIEYGPMGVE